MSSSATVRDRRLVDGAGRRLHLRGVSVNALVDYGRSGLTPTPVTDGDYDQMAMLGIDAQRLAVSWSRLMPEPGRLDESQLARITELVRAAGARGIRTLISLHSDRYAADLGTGTEFDGAPRWAVRTDNLPCGDPRPRYYTPCAAAAARAFYEGARVEGRELKEYYGDLAVAVAKAGRDGGPGYLGLDLLNEPTDPWAIDERLPTRRFRSALAGLQRRLVDRLRRSGENRPVWIQPQGARSTVPRGIAALPGRLSLPAVYAPHAYVDIYDRWPGAETPARVREQYLAFRSEARRIGGALVIGEYPGAVGGGYEDLRRLHLRYQDRLTSGGFQWLWKQPASGYGWGVLSADGALREGTAVAERISSPRVMAAPGSVSLRRSGARFELRARLARAGQIELWLGARLERRERPVSVLSGNVLVVSTSYRQATVGDRDATGTAISLRLPAGRTRAVLELGA